jgi:predicted O-methyltransferase YrrM
LTKPKTILEIGILDGYSLMNFVKATDPSFTQITAYDIFEKFNGNHSHEERIREMFKNNQHVEIQYGDFYEVHKSINNSELDLIHIDIANNGDTYAYAIEHYLPKLSARGIMLLEGGSKERDEVAWMTKYNKPKIDPLLAKYQELYNIKTIGRLPSLTLITKNN